MSGHKRGEEKELVNNPRYRRFVSEVEKALKAFEYTTEWADLIAALGKLSKVLQQNSKFGDIPKPVTIAKRLSQCLHPALPSGVHLKTLDTYRQIFELLGPKELSKLLYLYSVGLFPLMGYGGIKVRSELFKLLETYLLPLGAALRPALVGFITGVLPGLEEGTEFFDRTLTLLDGIKEAVSPEVFFTSLWESIGGSEQVRLPALLYIGSKFDKKKSMDDQLWIMGHSVDKMVWAVCAVCAASLDNTASSTLVQRHLLDFLCSAFPLDTDHLVRSDKVKILQRCLFVVLRRDMSLNRRLYSWLLGVQSSATGGSSAGVAAAVDVVNLQYFDRVTAPIVADCMRAFFPPRPPTPTDCCVGDDTCRGAATEEYEDDGAAVQDAIELGIKVCRVLLYTLDRGELGPRILNLSLIHFLVHAANLDPVAACFMNHGEGRKHSFYHEGSHNNKGGNLAKNLNLLLNSLEPNYLWNYLADRLQLCRKDGADVNTIVKVIAYCLRRVELDSHSDVRSVHLPQLLLALVQVAADGVLRFDADQLQALFACARLVLSQIQLPTAQLSHEHPHENTAEATESPKRSPRGDCDGENTVELAMKTLEGCIGPLLGKRLRWGVAVDADGRPLLGDVCHLLADFADFPFYCDSSPLFKASNEGMAGVDVRGRFALPEWLAALWRVGLAGSNVPFGARAKCIDLLVYATVRSNSVIAQHFHLRTRLLQQQNSQPNDRIDTNATAPILLKPILTEQCVATMEKQGFFQRAAECVWSRLDECETECHQQATRLFLLLHSLKPSMISSCCEDIAVRQLTSAQSHERLRAAKKFRTFWMLVRNYGNEEIFSGLPIKPFNRAVVVLLGYATAVDKATDDATAIRDVCIGWLTDCVQHGDLPLILQVVSVMLLKPSTTRVSIQYVQRRASGDDGRSSVDGVTTMHLAHAHHLLLHHVFADHATSPRDDSYKMTELRQKLLTAINDETAAYQTDDNFGGNDEGKMAAAKRLFPVASFDDQESLPELDNHLSASVDTGEDAIICLADSVEQDVRELLSDMLDSVCGLEEDIGLLESAAFFEYNQVSFRRRRPNALPVVKLREEQPLESLSLDSISDGEVRLFDGGAATTTDEDKSSGSGGLFAPLHAHLLFYTEAGGDTDLQRAQRLFQYLDALLTNDRRGMGRMIASCIASTGTVNLPRGVSRTDVTGNSWMASGPVGLLDLMQRHARALLGHSFWTAESEDSKTKHFTFLELLISVALYYLRSFYLKNPMCPTSAEELRQNWKTKVASVRFMDALLRELSQLLKENAAGKAFGVYLREMLLKCKLQKCLLHCLISCVHQTPAGNSTTSTGMTEPLLSVSVLQYNSGDEDSDGLLATYERCLLSLTQTVIQLEAEIRAVTNGSEQNASGINVDKLSVSHTLSPTHHSKHGSVSVVELRMFLLTVLNALKRRFDRHRIWMEFVVKILPYLERSLPTMALHVVEQLCKNLESVATNCYNESSSDSSVMVEYPTNYACTVVFQVLESLSHVLHYCTTSDASGGALALSTTTSSDATAPSGGSGLLMVGALPVRAATEIFTNLARVFSFADTAPVTATAFSGSAATDRQSMYRSQAKTDLLGAFPHSLSTLCQLWSAIKHNRTPTQPVGNPQQVRRLILDLLSPIAVTHSSHFLTALSLVWLTRGKQPTSGGAGDVDVSTCADYSDGQMDICDLVLSVKVLPVETLITAIARTIRQPVKVKGVPEKESAFPSTELSLLELLHGCLSLSPPALLRSCWPALQPLFVEAPVTGLHAPAAFVLFRMFCDYVRMCHSTIEISADERRASVVTTKSLQEVCQKMVEALNTIVGWQLEQTTWLKRTLVVKSDRSPAGAPSLHFDRHSLGAGTNVRGIDEGRSADPLSLSCNGSLAQHNALNSSNGSLNDSGGSAGEGGGGSSGRRRTSAATLHDANNNAPSFSAKALSLLADNLSNVVDAICRSEDKEKMLPTIQAVWANALPYLKTRSSNNARSFCAASKLLASLSSHAHTRPVWKKAAMDLFLDPHFFKMDVQSLRGWLLTVDNLVTHDSKEKGGFKEMMNKIAGAASTTLPSVFTSKDQEYEMRAGALKRLALILLSSHSDQYQSHLPEIQEKLMENLRIYQAPHVHANVFLCLKVLLIRLSTRNLVSLWPAIITELVQVLLQIEQELTDTSGNHELRGTAKTSSKGVSHSGVATPDEAARDDQWLSLYLSACKLLEALCLLPSSSFGQFQMYQWAFTSNAGTQDTSERDLFVPHAVRISKMLQRKYGKVSPHAPPRHGSGGQSLVTPLLVLGDTKSIARLKDLTWFFYHLNYSRMMATTVTDACLGEDRSAIANPVVKAIEASICVDLADGWVS